MNRFRFGLILCAVCNGSLLCAADLKGTDQPAVDAAAVAQVEKSLAATTQIRTEGELPLEDILSQFVREQNVPIRVDGASFHSQAIDMDHVPPLDFRGLIVREALQKLIRALAHKKQDFNPLITEASGLLYISANGQSKLNLETTAMWDKNIAYKQFTGTVVNADGSPAGGAVVQIWGGQQTFLPTNAEGQFRTPTNALVEQFTFLASDESGKQLGAWRVPSPDWRNPLRELPKIVITLRPAKPVIVEVVDRNNAPIKDAHVTITLARSRHIRLQTDVAGKVAYRYPAELSLNSVVALKAGDGLDYVSFEESTTPNETAKETPVGPTGDVRLKLEGATPIKVIVKDEDGNAAVGVQIYVERLSKRLTRVFWDHEGHLLGNAAIRRTNEDGEVVIDWFPSWLEMTEFHSRSSEFASSRFPYRRGKIKDNTIEFTLARFTEISGRVFDENRKPVADVSIEASGSSNNRDSFANTKSDKNGKYALKVASRQAYLIHATDAEGKRKDTQDDIAVYADTPVRDLEFELRPVVRVSGRLTYGTDQRPLVGESFDLEEKSKNTKFPGLDPSHTENRFGMNLRTDGDGAFECFLGPGIYRLHGPDQLEPRDFVIRNNDPTEKRFDFYSVLPTKSVLTGRVVTGNPPQPVGGVTITLNYANFQFAEVKTDDQGNFRIQRKLYPTSGLYARNADNTLAAVAELTPDSNDIEIKLRPTATTKARIFDASGKPLPAGKDVYYEVRVKEGKTMRRAPSGITQTDKDGRVELKGLVLGQEYHILLGGFQELTTFTPEEPGAKDLGELTAPKSNR